MQAPSRHPINKSLKSMTQCRWPTQLTAYPYAQPLLIGWQIADRERDIYWNDYEQASMPIWPRRMRT
ncbi:MAG: hypothetical protein MZV65_41005 [Chromatiales bacterium]|nr:hypothetical protein [Chromatiales bacterium]